jgi:hypothetical protein
MSAISPNFADVQEAALEALAEDGTGVKITRPGGGAYNPVTDVTTATTLLTQTAPAVADYVRRSNTDEGDFDPGTSTRRDFQILWLAGLALTFDPRPGDLAEWPAGSGVNWAIIGAKSVQPDGAPILWRCVIER